MRIAQLSITNFMGTEYSLSTLDQNGILFAGQNGAGKSTVLKAIRLLLIGDKRTRTSKKKSKAPATTVLDNAGDPLKAMDFIGKWGKKASISASIEHGDKSLAVSLVINKTGFSMVTDPMLPGDDERQAMYRYFGLPEKRLAVDPMWLLTNDDLLDGIMGDGNLDQDKLDALFGDNKDRVREYGFKLDTPADLKVAAEQAYKMRTDVNRDIKQLKAVVDGGCPPEPLNSKGKPVSTDMMPAVDNAIANLRDSQSDIMRRIGAAESHESNANLIAATRAQISSIKLETVPREPKVSVSKEMLDKKHAAYVTAGAELAGARKRMSVFESGECPTCGADIDANMSACMSETIELAEEAVKKVEADYAKLNKTYAVEQDAHRAWDERVKTIQAATEKREILKLELAKLEAQPEPENVDELRGEYETLSGRIQDGVLLRDKLVIIQRWHEANEKLDTLEDKAEFYSWFVDLLRDPALAASLAGDELQEFESATNEILTGFECGITVDRENGSILFGKDGVWRDVRNVSDGELVLVAFAVAESYAGEGIAVLDRLEALDEGVRETLFTLLESVEGGRYYAMSAKEPCGEPYEVWIGGDE